MLTHVNVYKCVAREAVQIRGWGYLACVGVCRGVCVWVGRPPPMGPRGLACVYSDAYVQNIPGAKRGIGAFWCGRERYRVVWLK